MPIPATYTELTKLLVSFALGYVYSVSGLRQLSNKWYSRKVNQDIINTLIQPHLNTHPELRDLTWEQTSAIFYRFIDNDNSLAIQSQLIRWNGFMWTLAADLRAAAVLGFLFICAALLCTNSIEGVYFDQCRATYPIVGLFLTFLLSFLFSSILTRRHIRLAKQQCTSIFLHYDAELLQNLLRAKG